MTEPAETPERGRSASFVGPLPPVEPTPELARRNVMLGLALLGVFVLIFAGTVVVAFVYLAVVD